MYNKKQYKEILDYFNKDLNLVNLEIKSLLFENNSGNYKNCTDKAEISNKPTSAFFEDISDFLFAKSKRLRPVVLFLIGNALGIKFKKNIIKLAAALELLHSATLIHDDIIDEAVLRRQKPTVNFKYNSKMAVISGDYLLSLCLEELSKINEPKIFEYFSKNTIQICKGEIDQFFNKNKVITIEKYIEKSKNKTSSLFIAGAKSILYLACKEKEIPVEIQENILNFVLNFSLAFQIYDDIENFQCKNTEKSSSDIENGIYTLPYLYISQQNHSCDIMDLKNKARYKKTYSEALNFSEKYLNDILDKALENTRAIQNRCSTALLQKLVETFKI